MAREYGNNNNNNIHFHIPCYRLEGLKHLKILDLSHNALKHLPRVVFNLRTLTTLDISDNDTLVRIDDQLLQLTELGALHCRGCHSLKYPPYAVCEQGVEAVRKYFTDLRSTRGVELTSVPVAIVGQKMSGKTSLVRSLQTGSRKLTERVDSSLYDEATKVFKIEDLELPSSQVKLIDYGGHEVYHIAYQLMLKDRYIPLIVVNLEEFSTLSSSRGPKEATRRLCFDWMAHLYLACPRLGPPILVFTHADKLTKESLAQCRTVLLNMTEVLRKEVIAEENERLGQHQDTASQMLHLSNQNVSVFSSENIFEFSNDTAHSLNIVCLNTHLDRRCKEFSVVIPRLWEDVGKFVEGHTDIPHIALSDIKSKYSGDDCLIILRYMHNIGNILWFENVEGLRHVVFHRIPVITEMISVLFHHCTDEQWKQRLDSCTSFRHGDQMISEYKYKSLIQKFTETGMLDEAVLMHLLKTESHFPPSIALELLRSFCIINGPIDGQPRSFYAVPYFATNFMDNSWKTDGSLQLRLEILLKGLALPKYVYQLMTVVVMNHTLSPTSSTNFAKNGVAIHHGESATYLVHDCNARKVTLQVSTTVELLGTSWKHLLDTASHILVLLSEVWKACHASILVYCSHCLFLRDPEAAYEVDPVWFYPIYKSSSADGPTTLVNTCSFSGVEPVTCRRHVACSKDSKPTVPKPLLYPCE